MTVSPFSLVAVSLVLVAKQVSDFNLVDQDQVVAFRCPSKNEKLCRVLPTLNENARNGGVECGSSTDGGVKRGSSTL